MIRIASSADAVNVSMALITSVFESVMGFPTSTLITIANSSLRCLIFSAISNRICANIKLLYMHNQ